MMDSFLQRLERGGAFIKNNPQVLYTFFLLIAIPAAFLYVGERFLSIAKDAEDRLERSRITIFHDAIAAFAEVHLDDPEGLKDRLSSILVRDETIGVFLIVRPISPSQYQILLQVPEGKESLWEPDLGTAFLFQIAGSGGVVEPETYLQSRIIEGTRGWEAVRVLKGPSGEALGYLYTTVAMANVDRLIEKEIRLAYLTLFLIIGVLFLLLIRHARIIDYATLYQRLAEVDRMKDDFVSMAAHELRSPLTIIRGYIEFLSDEVTSENGKRTLQNIDRSANQLSTLIGDILDVAKLQEGRMSFNVESIDPSALLREVAESFQKIAEDKKLAFTYTLPELPNIVADSNRLRQVLVNLIGNAIKYTPKGSVTVTAKADGGRVEIRVSDTGMGISAEDQKRLFEKFFRIKNEETKLIVGTGLGLWITQEMVKQMHGTISVESIKGKGSDFIVSFPIAKK